LLIGGVPAPTHVGKQVSCQLNRNAFLFLKGTRVPACRKEGTTCSFRIPQES
jgi:hypothetical protein